MALIFTSCNIKILETGQNGNRRGKIEERQQELPF